MDNGVLLDTVAEYNADKKKILHDLWEKIVLDVSKQFDHKKILVFLGKVGIIDIDENVKEVVIGTSNDFLLTQIKKNLAKIIKESVQNCYNQQYGVRFVVYPPFTDGKHELLINLKKLLNISENASEESTSKTTKKLENGIKSELNQYFGILFDPKYRFDTFVAGGNNQFAFSAAKAVAENPGKQNNPLFLYGDVGLGKTHLMQAVGNEIMEKYPEKVVIYLPATTLVEEIVQSLRLNKMANLKKKFDAVDVLLVDDIQFLADKEKTQEVFHDIFNDFYAKQKQVIISSDRPPRELIRIAPRLQSRFALGLIADLQAPDFETRIAILESKLQAKGMKIDFQYLSLLAQYVKSNVRELEGALNTLITRQQIMGGEITEQDIYTCLKTLGYYCEEGQRTTLDKMMASKPTSSKNFETLVEMLAEYYEISVSEIKSESRKKEIAQARQMLMYLAKKYFGWTYEKIGEYFGGMHHATAIHAINKIEKQLKTDTQIQHDCRVFEDRIQQ